MARSDRACQAAGAAADGAERSRGAALLAEMQGAKWLMASLLYGAGCATRMPDASGEGHRLRVPTDPRADGKGGKDRARASRVHISRCRSISYGYGASPARLESGLRRSLAAGRLARKYRRAGYQWGWQFVFPSKNRSTEPGTSCPSSPHLPGYPAPGIRQLRTMLESSSR